jgi:hypothetical protein
MPRKEKPRIARIDHVKISRDGGDAIIEFLDGSTATTHLGVGPQIRTMTDEEILLLFNQVVAARMRSRDELGEYVAVEVPVGSPQVERFAGTTTDWVPRGGVLRCVIDDGGGDDGSLPVVHVDDREFDWDEFGRMLCTHAGWGMRIVFVPNDELDCAPKIVVREPGDPPPRKEG